MTNIPSGKVTFLFTDIEGSTGLAQKFPDSYGSILLRHDVIMQEVIESNSGFIFKKVGDAVCASFDNELNAANSAIEIQKKLKDINSNEFEVKVRLGIHSGEAEYMNGDYSGYVTLSRVNRIMSIAHGGQILITHQVYKILKDNPEDKISFRDFGDRKLKDIILPEHVYQIVAEGLDSDFPPLKSLDARQNNLPSSITNFIGRRKEIDEIKKLFLKTRLLSLTGTGGTGKTRLAVQLASEMLDEFENGVWIVELSHITNPELIVKEILQVFNLKEDASRNILDIIIEFIKEKKLLLIFDNSEHLLERCAPIAKSLLNFCPGLKILSTSREPFNISGETVYRVPPLSIPVTIQNEDFDSLSNFESVKLFLDRASSINPNFKLTHENIFTIAELCKKLDGIPLAIELASKRISVLSVEKILERLNDRFGLLTRGSSTALPRQKTLRALIDWSYDMLNFKEQLLLQRVSIFMGGWTLEAAEEICSDDKLDIYEILDLMSGLVDKSLIVANEIDGKTRYEMLETIKEYSLEKLTDKLDDYNKHLEYFIKLTDYSLQKENGIEQYEWLKIIESEIDNIRTCIQRAIEHNQEEAGIAAANMYDFWQNKGYFQEGFETMQRVLNTVQINDKKTKAHILVCLAQMQYLFGDFSKLEEFSNEALGLFKEINYREGIIRCFKALSLKAHVDSNFEHALKLNEEALELSKEINSKSWQAESIYGMSSPLNFLGQKEKSIEAKEEALKLFRESGDEHSVALVLVSLSISEAHIRNNLKKSMALSEESLAISEKIDDRYFISMILTHLGSLHLMYDKKDYASAEYLLSEAYRISKTYGYDINLFPIRIYLGYLYLALNKIDEALEIYKEYISEREKSGAEFYIKEVFKGFARIHLQKKEYERAIKLFGFIDTLSKDKKYKNCHNGFIFSEERKNKLKEDVGEEKFNLLWDEGASLNIDEVINSELNN